jgi:hypothetical protein
MLASHVRSKLDGRDDRLHDFAISLSERADRRIFATVEAAEMLWMLCLILQFCALAVAEIALVDRA